MPPADAAGPLAGATRRVPGALLAVAGLLLAVRVATGVLEHFHPPKTHEEVAWRPITEAEAAARGEKKPILYDFTADWCLPCERMRRELFADEDAARTIHRLFIPVRVVDRTREEGRNTAAVDELQQRFGVTSFPTLVAVRLEGGEPVVITGYEGKRKTLQALMQASFKLGMTGAFLPPGQSPSVRVTAKPDTSPERRQERLQPGVEGH